MRLGSALEHIDTRHGECWSCHLERLLLVDMMEGKGHIMRVQDDPFPPFASGRVWRPIVDT